MNIKVVCFCLSVVGGASVQRRDTYETPPCFINDSADPVDHDTDCEQLNEYAAETKLSITGMRYQSERLIKIMEIEYCSQGETNSFMNISVIDTPDKNGIFLQNPCLNIETFLEKTREHYNILNELANYFEHLRLTANDNYYRELVTSFQGNIYDCMCSMKMTLRASGQNPVITVPNGSLSQTFTCYYNGTVCERQTAQYISVLDGYQIATNLETIYS